MDSVDDTPVNRTPVRASRLLVCGIVGPTIFVLAFLIEGATRPGYNAWLQAVSALSLSAWGWMQIATFIVSGVCFCVFALGLRRSLLTTGRNATWGPILVAAVGLGLIVAGVFVTDPAQGYPPGTPNGPSVTMTWHGTIHFFGGAVAVFGLLPLACFVLARTFADNRRHWSNWAAYSIASGILMWAFFVAFAVAAMHGGPSGLYERIALGVGFGWVVVLAARLIANSRPLRKVLPSSGS